MKPKNTLLLSVLLSTLVLCSSPYVVFSQNADDKKVELQFKTRTSFYSVDDRYNLITDTIYHANDGFRTFSGYDTQTIGNKEYIILKYPNWRRNDQLKQKSTQQHQIIQSNSKILLSIKELLNDESDKSMLDSLKQLLDTENEQNPIHVEIVGRDSLKLAILKTDFDEQILKGAIDDVYSLRWRHSTKLSSGFMSIPFKLRPKQDSVNFNMTTDITLGAYLGVKKRISRKANNFIIIPATLGLSYINVGNSETSNVNTEKNSSVIPGWSWSSGFVFELSGFNVGFVLGQDFASGVGSDWLYNKKIWYSFSIGYSFFSKAK